MRVAPWTDVVSFSNTSATANTSALDAGWTAMSRYPNYVEQAGELEQPQDARYLRLIYTESFSGRWLELNEIIINDMEVHLHLQRSHHRGHSFRGQRRLYS